MKHRLWFIFFLLLIWCGFSNNFSLLNIVLGLCFSCVINLLAMSRNSDFSIDIVQLLILIYYMVWELFRSSVEVAWDILRPASKSQSGLIELPLQCEHPVQISLLMNLISLTPGTLAVDVSEDRKSLIIHLMFAQNRLKTLAFIQQKLESRTMKVIRYG